MNNFYSDKNQDVKLKAAIDKAIAGSGLRLTQKEGGYDYDKLQEMMLNMLDKCVENIRDYYPKPSSGVTETDAVSAIKTALAYRDFGVLNEYLNSIGEEKIEASGVTGKEEDVSAPSSEAGEVVNKSEIISLLDALRDIDLESDFIDPPSTVKKCGKIANEAIKTFFNNHPNYTL